jgi:hypothetical protein
MDGSYVINDAVTATEIIWRGMRYDVYALQLKWTLIVKKLARLLASRIELLLLGIPHTLTAWEFIYLPLPLLRQEKWHCKITEDSSSAIQECTSMALLPVSDHEDK